jgi:predicted alpha/beta hydrolase family esterase
MNAPTVLIVPGLREHVAEHWQTLLALRLPASGYKVRTVPPMGRVHLDCAARVAALEQELARIDGPVILVAHSGGVITVVHWALQQRRPIRGALLAAPPDFERPMPEGYPTMESLCLGGWLPVPRDLLPFPSIVAASRNDPLCKIERAAEFARAWGSHFVDIGEAGHLNPASGYGVWPRAQAFIREVSMLNAAACAA